VGSIYIQKVTQVRVAGIYLQGFQQTTLARVVLPNEQIGLAKMLNLQILKQSEVSH
jgi:hypothetical protein